MEKTKQISKSDLVTATIDNKENTGTKITVKGDKIIIENPVLTTKSSTAPVLKDQ